MIHPSIHPSICSSELFGLISDATGSHSRIPDRTLLNPTQTGILQPSCVLMLLAAHALCDNIRV